MIMEVWWLNLIMMDIILQKNNINYENENQLWIGGKVYLMKNQIGEIVREILNNFCFNKIYILIIWKNNINKCKFYSKKNL